ncbi:hypothetical protein [Vibrio sp. SCSIO 43136]|uniref:hypothetical protein n=1 Tax=Vibrio sp. SCSIO 43136 TaxID=2819101 RepID=UPI0020765C31|nr:hypothetical protein [Vibrio sp. SCSIO 43136]USD67738.1 hypothetical protein J4N39_16250 [Vibrio sp. SCSIO 43136]
MSLKSHLSIQFVLNLVLAFVAHADVIKISKPKTGTDQRYDYPTQLLKLALEASIDEYGPYDIIESDWFGPRDRMLQELLDGGKINVHNAPTRREWEERALPVYFPILKGILGYRILLIHQDNITKFEQIYTLNDLQRLSAGLGEQWSITKALREVGGFKIVTGTNYEGLFGMLMAKRFDYFIRGVSEIFPEYQQRSNVHPKMVIEQSLVIEMPLPVYFFVSPKHPEIADRILYGLEKMKADGSFEEEFMKANGDPIKQAQFAKRRHIKIENPTLPLHPIYDEPSYWLDLNKQH